MGHDWADREATKRLYALLARDVFPRFQDSGRHHRVDRVTGRSRTGPTFIGAAGAAVMAAMQKHHAEKAAKAEAADGGGRPAGPSRLSVHTCW